VNVALKRPAWQSSVMCDKTFGCHDAFKVTDGYMATNHFVPPGCAHGEHNRLNPWLAIDLGVPIYVDGVDVTSRKDCSCGEFRAVKAKIRYTIVGDNRVASASLQQVRNINDKSVTSWQLPRLRGSFGETCVMDFGHAIT